MMARLSTWALPVAIVLVPVSSILGLLRPLRELEGNAVREMWIANLWGDVVFTLGTIGIALFVFVVVAWSWHHTDPVARALAPATIPIAFGLTWLLYALSWAISGPYYAEPGGFFALTPLWENNFRTVWEWGNTGIWSMSFLTPIAGFLLTYAPAAPAGGARAMHRTPQVR